MKSFSILLIVSLGLTAFQAVASPVLERQAPSSTIQSSNSGATSSAVTSSGSVEALTTEVHSPGASFAGPPTSRPFTLPDYPGYGQYTAYFSAVSAAASLGNITAPFAQPTGFTTYDLDTGVPNAPTILRTGDVCPTGMVGVDGKCCPGVVVEGQCLRTDTAPLPTYATFTGVASPSNTADHSGTLNAKALPIWASMTAFTGVASLLALL